MSARRKTTRTSFGNVRRLPSGRYQARYTDVRMDRHTAPQTFATKKHAEDWLATVRTDMVRGTWRAPELGRMTVEAYATAHLATRLDLAPKTRQLYASVLDHWLTTPLDFPSAPGRRARTVNIGATELGSLKVAAVRDWHAAALHTAASNAERRAESHLKAQRAAAVHDARSWARANGLDVKKVGRLPQSVIKAWTAAGSPAARHYAELTSPSPSRAVEGQANGAGRAQVAQAYRLLRMILGHAVREGRIDANPCQITGAGHVKATERVPATPAQVADLATAMPERYRAAVHLAAWSGLRAGELFGLARRHVDLDAGTVRVERAVTYLNGQAPYLGQTKTAASRRTVHLPPHVVSLLREHMRIHTGPDTESLVFTDRDGNIVSKDTRQQAFARARVTAGCADLRWHDLRHTGATLASHAGASLRELQHRLGHTTVAAAMIYQHATADRDRDLAQRMGTLHDLPSNVVSLPTRGATA
jgi:integrase